MTHDGGLTGLYKRDNMNVGRGMDLLEENEHTSIIHQGGRRAEIRHSPAAR